MKHSEHPNNVEMNIRIWSAADEAIYAKPKIKMSMFLRDTKIHGHISIYDLGLFAV